MKGEPRHSLNEPCQWPLLAPVQPFIIPANVQPPADTTGTCSGNTGEARRAPARFFQRRDQPSTPAMPGVSANSRGEPKIRDQSCVAPGYLECSARGHSCLVCTYYWPRHCQAPDRWQARTDRPNPQRIHLTRSFPVGGLPRKTVRLVRCDHVPRYPALIAIDY